MKNTFSYICASILLSSATWGGTISSTFDTDTENWLATGDVHGMAWSFSVGFPAGSFLAVDDATGSTWYFVAPSKYLGDKSAYYGGNFSYDIRVSDVSADWNAAYMMLTGNGLTLNWYSSLPSIGTWTTYSVGLVESAGWFNAANNQPATALQMKQVLSNLSSLQVRGEFMTGSDYGYLDNVLMVPEPLSVGIVGLGALLIRRK